MKEIRKFKRDDVIELNEENVLRLFHDCSATEETPKGNIVPITFSVNPVVTKVNLQTDKILENREKLCYLLGQTYYRHYHKRNNMLFQLPVGGTTYTGKPWTSDIKLLFAFYYLQNAGGNLAHFNTKDITYIIDEDINIPTLSPNDPKFEEWAKVYIED